MNAQIPVTVSVLTYNSSKYVLETLESIKAQTYKSLILHISDDCSTDNTVRICRKWIEDNKDRFVETKIIIPDKNTGISGNLNRAIDACKTEWLKVIAGDDILMPNCIEEYMSYVSANSEVVVAFSHLEAFGMGADTLNELFDGSFFKLSPEEQYKSLIFEGNSAPAPASFFNVNRLRKLDIKADERIPMLEDYPMWINLTKKGIKLQFIDKVLVNYRVGAGGIASGGGRSLAFRKSLRLFYLYYQFPALLTVNPEKEICKVIDYELGCFQEIQLLLNSPSYKLGTFLLSPIKWALTCLKCVIQR